MPRVVRGAVIDKRPAGPVSPARPSVKTFDTMHSEAHRIALANKRKPWARRWLKENGHWC